MENNIKRLFGIENKCNHSWTHSSETEAVFNKKKESLELHGFDNLHYYISAINTGAKYDNFDKEQLTELRKMYFETLVAWYDLFPDEKCEALTQLNNFREEEN